MEDNESRLLELFFNSPKHWHFEELLLRVHIARPNLSKWLAKLTESGIIRRIKKKGEMPYYVQDFVSASFHTKKKLFALQRFQESGFLDHLVSLRNAKAIVLFGSFSRSDWYEDSDIDVFIYGDDSDFEQGKYEKILGREIQVHTAKDKKDLRRMKMLLPHILSGDFMKGTVDDLGVKISA